MALTDQRPNRVYSKPNRWSQAQIVALTQAWGAGLRTVDQIRTHMNAAGHPVHKDWVQPKLYELGFMEKPKKLSGAKNVYIHTVRHQFVALEARVVELESRLAALEDMAKYAEKPVVLDGSTGRPL